MGEHGMIGRRYAGEVKQIISGSIGLDDWEWGVTLWSMILWRSKKLITKCGLMKQRRVRVVWDVLRGVALSAAQLGKLLAEKCRRSKSTFVIPSRWSE